MLNTQACGLKVILALCEVKLNWSFSFPLFFVKNVVYLI